MNKVERKVYALQTRGAKRRYYRGVVIGVNTFERGSMSIFNNPSVKYNEDKLLVKMSNGKQIQVWESETFKVVPPTKGGNNE